MKDHFAMFAAYNRWANRRLYDAAAKLDDAEYRAALGAFFGSMHGTLNHLLATDRIWLRRFTGAGEAPARLDAILFEELVPLTVAREAEDERIAGFIDSLSEADLAGSFTYRTITQPRDMTQKRAPALAHLFNHQTHHRGQAHGLLTALRGNAFAPSLDLILFQRETGIGMD